MAIFGGLIFALYPIAVARTHDLFEPEAIVPVSSVLLLFYGIGATVGPVAASHTIALSGRPQGLFLFCAAAGGLYAAVTFYFRRRGRVEFVPVDDQVRFRPMNRTSAVVMQIDPRGETPQD
jgi:MFS family permease